mgnify:CR=1 FL=1
MSREPDGGFLVAGAGFAERADRVVLAVGGASYPQTGSRGDGYRIAAALGGDVGTGKTHLLTALGYVACQKGISVRFTRVIDMINDLTAAQLAGTLGKALKAYTQPSLLLLDELGYLPVDKRGADLMFQVVAARYEAGSIVITTNRAFKDWGAILDVDNTLATALIDRLMHHGEAIAIQGGSYRMKDRKDDIESPQ